MRQPWINKVFFFFFFVFITSRLFCLRFSWLTFLILPSDVCLNNKIHFSLANAVIIGQVLKENWFKITGFAHSQTTNKLVNEAAKDSARVRGQDRKKPPALGTNQFAGFGQFRPLASLEKINIYIYIYIYSRRILSKQSPIKEEGQLISGYHSQEMSDSQ